jgi:hypothetical protein
MVTGQAVRAVVGPGSLILHREGPGGHGTSPQHRSQLRPCRTTSKLQTGPYYGCITGYITWSQASSSGALREPLNDTMVRGLAGSALLSSAACQECCRRVLFSISYRGAAGWGCCSRDGWSMHSATGDPGAPRWMCTGAESSLISKQVANSSVYGTSGVLRAAKVAVKCGVFQRQRITFLPSDTRKTRICERSQRQWR